MDKRFFDDYEPQINDDKLHSETTAKLLSTSLN